MASAALLSAVTSANVCCVFGGLYGLKMYLDGFNNEKSRESKRRSRHARKAPMIIQAGSSSDEESDQGQQPNFIYMPKSKRSAMNGQDIMMYLSSNGVNGNTGNPGSRRGSKQTSCHSSVDPLSGGHFEAMEAGWQGFSMEEARRLADLNHEAAASMTPQDVLSNLQKGNMRFWTGSATRPEKSAFERRALISKQFPLVAVLSCSDSRVPPEILFDVGLGDMFVIRVAGNCLDTAALASLQYAIKYLKVKVVMVMGHEGCGAVKAAGMPSEDINKEPHALARLLNNLKGGLEHGRLQWIQDSRAMDREAVVTNVKRQVELLAREDTVMDKVAKNEIICVGSFYEISSGIVDFFSELAVKAEDAAGDTKAGGRVGRTYSRGVSGVLEVQFNKQ